MPPCGGHLGDEPGPGLVYLVSSRAPVWGASMASTGTPRPKKCFKSCPRVGGIGDPKLDMLVDDEFQVVPPCGGHPITENGFAVLLSFKSCPRVGGIRFCQSGCRQVRCFKSCPRVGGISIRWEIRLSMCVSSRAPVWGASPIPVIQAVRQYGFKSCPRVGGIRCMLGNTTV